VVLLVVAPYLGEVLSTATTPLQLLVPWRLGPLVALYGAGALLCRELAVRFGLGLPGLALLGAAYGVYEEALVDRFWFDQGYADSTGIGRYAEIWHTNVLLAVHLTAFHTAVSICSSVLLVTWLFPGVGHQTWIPRWGLVVAAIAVLTVPFLIYDEYIRPLPAQMLVALALGIACTAAAFRTPYLRRFHGRASPGRGARDRAAAPRSGTSRLFRVSRRGSTWTTPRPRLLGFVAFLCTGAQFVLTYTVRLIGLPWPLGLVVAAAPILIGIVVVRRLATTGPLGRDGFWVVTGILSFFMAHDVLIGLTGRYDLIAGVLVALVLILAHRRTPALRPSWSGKPNQPEAGAASTSAPG
jgi:preprotein translocase subunit Sec61beta